MSNSFEPEAKVETSKTIDGRAVERSGTVGDLVIYFACNQGDNSMDTLFITKDGGVLGSVDVSCGMSQGGGFVDGVTCRSALGVQTK